ncbi:hypothetical protein MES5069_220195 [Mesorhizobium escarrei]|uniref:Uncharacterized protein n=1 Tax=Mesorhizobium escarrei TaxID=666018 RepID=A0ABM9DTJ7_9HYPH|nr:hypothetical protein MES5069_220195 [Mesorhizobium escarrei]
MHKSCLFRAGKLRFSAVSRASQTIKEVEDSRLPGRSPAVVPAPQVPTHWEYATLAERARPKAPPQHNDFVGLPLHLRFRAHSVFSHLI